MNFKRILVAINHSSITSTVFNRALNLAKEQANLMILSCLTDPTTLDPLIESGATLGFYPNETGFPQVLNNEVLQLEIRQAEAWLKGYCQQAIALNIPTEYQYRIGNPGVEICQVAQQWNADLVILGRHDQPAIAEFFTGSVSNYVIHHANCSVLVVKNQEPENTGKRVSEDG